MTGFRRPSARPYSIKSRLRANRSGLFQIEEATQPRNDSPFNAAGQCGYGVGWPLRPPVDDDDAFLRSRLREAINVRSAHRIEHDAGSLAKGDSLQQIG